MNDSLDIRWKQRYQNFVSALAKLDEVHSESGSSKAMRDALMLNFILCYELSHNLMRDYMMSLGNDEQLNGTCVIFRAAFHKHIIPDGADWLDMVVTRNEVVHTYNEALAIEVAEKIRMRYILLFHKLKEYFSGIIDRPMSNG